MGYLLARGGGQAVQADLPCPLPRNLERMGNPQILLHHLHVLQEYLDERDINFISVNLRCLLQSFSWVTYWQGLRASCPGWFILPLSQNFGESIISNFYYTMLGFSYLSELGGQGRLNLGKLACKTIKLGKLDWKKSYRISVLKTVESLTNL